MSDYYELLTNDTKTIGYNTFWRLRATKNFKNPYRDVKKGELGGYVSGNSLQNNSWVFGNAIVLNCILNNNSYIVGDFTYSHIFLDNGSIQGTCDYNNTHGNNRVYGYKIVGSSFIKASKHSVIWGTNKKNEVVVNVGCQTYTLNRWKEEYKDIANNQGYNLRIKEYLGHLKTIEDSLKPSNEKVLTTISELINSMKFVVTEASKTDVISLINQLKPTEKVVVQSGPKRDKFGRFAKKTT